MVAALLLGISLGRASDGDETTMTVQVSSAEHESDEGYFSLGKDATVMAKPGSDLHRFLTRQNGRQVRVTLTLMDGRQLSRIERRIRVPRVLRVLREPPRNPVRERSARAFR
jgi:hypothetical protein